MTGTPPSADLAGRLVTKNKINDNKEGKNEKNTVLKLTTQEKLNC
jgi:hypothetical protein